MADRLNFYFYPSPTGLNWSSPRSLSLSVLTNRINPFVPSPRHPMGHVNIEVTTDTDDGRSHRHFITGMVAQETGSQLKLVLVDQIGLSVLFHSFPGHIEDESEIVPQFEPRMRQGSMSILSLKISPAIRDRLIRYEKSYREKNWGHSYGLANRPLHGEGAGCSAYAASFLQVAGLELPEFRDNWSQTIRLPNSLLGDPAKKIKVPYPRILFKGIPWAKASDPKDSYRSIFFWDPDRMHSWTVKTFDTLLKGGNPFPERKAHFEKRGKSVYVEFDFSEHSSPEKPEWHLYASS
jgi:hypothetical protein